MLRITRETDYGVVLLTRLTAAHGQVMNARDLSSETHIPLPTASKILKALARGGLLTSHRGVKGGYSLAREPESISVASVIQVLEGPIALTDCATAHMAEDGSPNGIGEGNGIEGNNPTPETGDCEHLAGCPVYGNWNRINQAIQATLESISLVEMARTEPDQAQTPQPRTMEV